MILILICYFLYQYFEIHIDINKDNKLLWYTFKGKRKYIILWK